MSTDQLAELPGLEIRHDLVVDLCSLCVAENLRSRCTRFSQRNLCCPRLCARLLHRVADIGSDTLSLICGQKSPKKFVQPPPPSQPDFLAEVGANWAEVRGIGRSWGLLGLLGGIRALGVEFGLLGGIGARWVELGLVGWNWGLLGGIGCAITKIWLPKKESSFLIPTKGRSLLDFRGNELLENFFAKLGGKFLN